jgi:hypothetical protein
MGRGSRIDITARAIRKMQILHKRHIENRTKTSAIENDSLGEQR